jgi:hypothetical protein
MGTRRETQGGEGQKKKKKKRRETRIQMLNFQQKELEANMVKSRSKTQSTRKSHLGKRQGTYK